MNTLAYPWMLLLLALLPLLAWYWLRRGARPVLRYSDLVSVARARGRLRSALHGLLPVLRLAAIASVIVALARPQEVRASKSIYAEGVAIMMVLDVSSSMLTTDLSQVRGQAVTRLDVVKDVFRRFVTGDDELPGRENDLIGMVRFARYADTACPLTLDHDHLLRLLAQTDAVRVRSEDGTAIGDGLGLAVDRLKDLERTAGTGEQLEITSRVIILLTDGENNRGLITPQEAGDLAAKYGIKVYTIMAGVGRQAGFGFLPVDDSALREIAEQTGGRHYRARSAGALRDIYEEIDQLERSRTEERRYEVREERAQPWLLAAFVALASHTVLAATWLRKVP